MDDQTTIIYLNSIIDKLLTKNNELQMKLDSTTELVDFYVKHYEELGYVATTRRFKELQEDVENAVNFKE